MARVRSEHRDDVVACDLDAAERRTRTDEWLALRDRSGLGATRLDGGACLWLRPDAAADAADLVRREARCCGFLDFELVAAGDCLHLDITSPVAGGVAVAAVLAGLEPVGGNGCC